MTPVGAIGTKDNIGAKGQRDGVGKTSTARRAVKHTAEAIWIRSTNTIEEVQPRVLVFNGKKAASKYFLISTTKLDYGRQQEGIGATTLFVASSTSGRNRHWTRSPWYDCARLVQDLRRG